MAGISATYVDTDQFTVTGDQSDDFSLGRRVQAECGVDGTKYGWVLSTSVSGDTTVTLTPDSDALTANLTEVYYAQTDIDHHPNIVSASVNLTDNALIRGDGGTKGVQTSTVLMSNNGEMTNPSQPCFLVRPLINQENIPADGLDYTVNFGTEILDNGNNFTGSVFTAPISGSYHFNTNIRAENMDTAASYCIVRILTSNRHYTHIIHPNFSADLTYFTFSVSVIADMDANDTAKVIIQQTGGTAQMDVATDSHFSGVLIA